ncbi:MAG: hypothetical protein GOMPHAMPRED_004063 [Gomphillus americanus]|uniref:Cytochrome P450 n=1 Tax=Gomphillus americanus TaxID=1940652 RepID=A0A8H3INY8_9LECA|nr:MAG: hypothetical protein GOMPHAMPRED_004063 [Gomphillus americanus]
MESVSDVSFLSYLLIRITTNSSTTYVVFTILLPTLAIFLFQASSKNRARLPPGPKPAPIIGNLQQVLQARKKSPHPSEWLLKLASYGEMTTLKMGAQTWILLNSNRVVNEIIGKRAAITSERPHMPVSQGLVSQNKRSVLRQTKDWTAGRKLMQRMLSGGALREYGDLQDEMSIAMLQNYLDEPKSWYRHHYRYAYNIIHKVVVGKRSQHTQHELDEFQRVTMEFVKNINASIIDFFPWLSRLPSIFQPGYTQWKSMGNDHYNVIKSWWEPVKKDLAEKDPAPSFVSDILMRDSKFSADEDEAMYLSTSIVAAGSDNVRMTLNVFIMAMLDNPKVFAKARSDLDVVCGSNAERLPTLQDMESLPYILAIIKEGLRWRPTVPVIPQHRLTKDLDFEGYHFPANTDFIINGWAVGSECDEPEKFIPERWMNAHVHNIVNGVWQFGGGRRVCVGYALAKQELFLAYSRLIYCFDWVAVSVPLLPLSLFMSSERVSFAN